MMILDVRIESYEAPAGRLTRADSGVVAFQYTPDYLARPDALPISLALPLQEAAFDDYRTRAYFANLLPENDQLQTVMERERLERDDVAGLLFHLGADCSGAVSCLPEGAPPVKVPGLLGADYEFLTPETVADIMRRLADREPLPDHIRDPSPVAGVQRKIAIVAAPDGRVALPKQGLGVPTTHILKVPARAAAREADLEAAAARLARACGLDAALSSVVEIEGVSGLLIPRFDRQFAVDGTIRRIHQEDFAQALGLPPSLKYERGGGERRAFTLAAIASVIARCAAPARALDTFLQATFFNLAIGNTDNHAKNHALLYDAGAAPSLAPLYDLLPIKLNNRYTHQLAFHIGKARSADALTIADFAILFRQLGFTERAASRFVEDKVGGLLRRLDEAADEHLGGLKDFADLIGMESRRLVEILELPVRLKERDYFTPAAGGWAAS